MCTKLLVAPLSMRRLFELRTLLLPILGSKVAVLTQYCLIQCYGKLMVAHLFMCPASTLHLHIVIYQQHISGMVWNDLDFQALVPTAYLPLVLQKLIPSPLSTVTEQPCSFVLLLLPGSTMAVLRAQSQIHGRLHPAIPKKESICPTVWGLGHSFCL